MPKISVWLTSYNHERFIEDSIKSILAQTYTDYELYIIDDCSSDKSWNIIQKYAQEDARIKAIRHLQNQGDSGLRYMVHELQGEYVAMAHSDDLWEPEKLERQVKVLEENPNVAACFTLVNVIDDAGENVKDEKHPYHRVFEQPNRTKEEWLNHFFYNGNGLCHPSLLIRKKAYTEMNIFTKGLNGLPDLCQWIRLCKQADIYILQERLTKFRVHNDGSNTSGENAGSIIRLHTEQWFLLKEYVELIDLNAVLQVFPDAQKYMVDGRVCQKYALAQVFLNHPGNYYKLYGLQMLYELFQDSVLEQEVLQLYGYTRRKYNVDKQKYDVFNVIPENRYLDVGIYLNDKNGYSEENKISKRVFVQNTGAFCLEIPLVDYEEDQLKCIRVDLDEGKYRKFKLCHCTCKDGNIEYEPVNGIKDGNWDVFYTMDPQYVFRFVKKGWLYIEGYVEEIARDEVEQYNSELRQYNNKLRQYNNEMQCRYDEIQQHCQVLNEEIERMKNTKIWKMRNRILKILRK